MVMATRVRWGCLESALKDLTSRRGGYAADPNYRVFLDAASNGKTSAPIAQWGQIEPTLQEQLQAVWDDVANLPRGQQISAEQVKSRLDAAARAVNGYLRSS